MILLPASASDRRLENGRLWPLHVMPRRRKPTRRHQRPERFVFVRDGFYFWAMIFGAALAAAHRLWLVVLAALSW